MNKKAKIRQSEIQRARIRNLKFNETIQFKFCFAVKTVNTHIHLHLKREKCSDIIPIARWWIRSIIAVMVAFVELNRIAPISSNFQGCGIFGIPYRINALNLIWFQLWMHWVEYIFNAHLIVVICVLLETGTGIMLDLWRAESVA